MRLLQLRHECNSEPVAAVFFSVALGMGLLFIGNLDIIAPILTMFLLLTYCLANVACLVHSVSGHPNWRPRFRFFSWHTALVGTLICVGTMVFLDWLYTSIAIAFCTFLIYMISYQSAHNGQSWGSVSQSLIFEVVSKYLLRLDIDEAHVKYWRPQFLVPVQDGPCGLVRRRNRKALLRLPLCRGAVATETDFILIVFFGSGHIAGSGFRVHR